MQLRADCWTSTPRPCLPSARMQSTAVQSGPTVGKLQTNPGHYSREMVNKGLTPYINLFVCLFVSVLGWCPLMHRVRATYLLGGHMGTMVLFQTCTSCKRETLSPLRGRKCLPFMFWFLQSACRAVFSGENCFVCWLFCGPATVNTNTNAKKCSKGWWKHIFVFIAFIFGSEKILYHRAVHDLSG